MKAVSVFSQSICLLVCLFAAKTQAAGEVKTKSTDVETYVDAQWIWSPSQTKDEVPRGDCFFRKTFTIANPEAGKVHITAEIGRAHV